MAKMKTSSVVTLRDCQKLVASYDAPTTRAVNDSPTLAEGVFMEKHVPKPDALAQEMPVRRGFEKATPFSEALGHMAQSAVSRFTQGLSPAARMVAWFDWATHKAAAPGK